MRTAESVSWQCLKRITSRWVVFVSFILFNAWEEQEWIWSFYHPHMLDLAKWVSAPPLGLPLLFYVHVLLRYSNIIPNQHVWTDHMHRQNETHTQQAVDGWSGWAGWMDNDLWAPPEVQSRSICLPDSRIINNDEWAEEKWIYKTSAARVIQRPTNREERLQLCGEERK